MSKTYRALAIVAIVAPLVSIGSVLLSLYIVTSGIIPPSPPGGERSYPLMFFPVLWSPAITSFAAPAIATFGAVVAVQTRRWGWLVAFLLVGLFSVFGPTPFVTFAPYVISAEHAPVGAVGPVTFVTGFGLTILLAIVALIFALTQRDSPATNATTATVSS